MLPAASSSSRKRGLTPKQFTSERTDSIEIENVPVVVVGVPHTKRMHADEDEDQEAAAAAASTRKRALTPLPADSKRLRALDDVSEYSAINRLLGDLYVERVSRRERGERKM